MKSIYKAIIKQLTLIIFLQAIAVAHTIHGMKALPTSSDYNNSITVENKSKPDIQLLYKRKKYDNYERKYYFLNVSGIIGQIQKCKMAQGYDNISKLELYDPLSQEKSLFLRAYDNEIITIHAISEKISRITVENNVDNHGAIELGKFTYT